MKGHTAPGTGNGSATKCYGQAARLMTSVEKHLFPNYFKGTDFYWKYFYSSTRNNHNIMLLGK